MENTNIKYKDPNAAWRTVLFSLNNAATNISLALMGFYAYYTQNVLGLLAVIVGLIATFSRVFDAITDPIYGLLMDNYSGKHGKLRPFMFAGNILIWIPLILLFTTPAGWSTNIKYMYTTILYVIYILGYTAQNTVTRAGQAIVTDDPKIRPIVSATDTIATQLVFALIPLLITTILAPKFSVGEFADGKGLINPETWKYAVLILAPISFLLTCIAAYGISAKDRPENYKLVESGEKFKFSDYKKVIANNRPLQMLIVAASTDKIGQLLTNGISTYLFANLLLNSSLQGNFGLITVIPIIICAFIGVKISRTFGMKRTFVVASWVNIVLTALMFLVGTNPEKPWIFLSLFLLQKALFGMGSGVVLPMVGDCADYEFYRSGNFIPGMIGTAFSFVDKAMSSLSTVIQGAALAVAGVGATKIIPNQPVSGYFNTVVLFCICIVPLLGSVASVIAMKYYKLDISTMMTIREENIRRRKEGMPEVLVDEIYS